MRLEFYLVALGISVLTFALSIVSLVLPNWFVLLSLSLSLSLSLPLSPSLSLFVESIGC